MRHPPMIVYLILAGRDRIRVRPVSQFLWVLCSWFLCKEKRRGAQTHPRAVAGWQQCSAWTGRHPPTSVSFKKVQKQLFCFQTTPCEIKKKPVCLRWAMRGNRWDTVQNMLMWKAEMANLDGLIDDVKPRPPRVQVVQPDSPWPQDRGEVASPPPVRDSTGPWPE